MKATTALCLAIALAAVAGPANAIFKCTTAKGVVYQDRPCRDGNEADINIVIPTGELAPRASGGADDGATANTPRSDDRATAPRATRNAGESSAAATRRGSDAAANGGETSLRSLPRSEKAVPATADQARKARSFRQVLRDRGIRRRRRHARPDELRIAFRRKAGLLPEQRQADVDLIPLRRRSPTPRHQGLAPAQALFFRPPGNATGRSRRTL